MTANDLSPVALDKLSSEVALPDRPEVTGLKKQNAASESAPLFPEDTEQERELRESDVEEVAKFLNDSAKLFDVSLKFRLEEDINRIVVSVVNKETEEVVRQIPPQEIIDLANRLSEMVGVLFNETA
jgi:flagellar protein FlaG